MGIPQPGQQRGQLRSTGVHLDYEMPPSVFELLVPGVTINDENIVVPPIRFEYDDFLAYQFVPLLVNF